VGFFNGQNYIKVDGQKNLTISKPLLEYTNPKTVIIPLKNMGYEDFDVHVEVGSSVKIGTKLATGKDHNKLPLFSSVSGVVKAIEKRDHISLKKTNHIVIENDFKDEKELLFEPVADFSILTDIVVKEHLKNAGVLGLGGSGIQTFTKFRNTKNVDTILINGLESDMFMSSDEYNMAHNTELLIKVAKLFLKVADAQKCVIAVAETKNSIVENLIKLAKDNSEENSTIEIKALPDEYPAGVEKLLIKRLFDKTYKMLPLEAGIISLNVSTAIEFAKTLNTGLPLYERVITLAGDGFANSQNVKVRIGTLLTDILSEIGGYSSSVTSAPKEARLVHGGPLRGDSVITDNLCVTPITAGFTCLANAIYEETACSRCSACINSCPVDIQPIQILRAFSLKSKESLISLSAANCIECGICSYVCPSNIDVSDATKKGRALALQK